jgi:hypothetical protein
LFEKLEILRRFPVFDEVAASQSPEYERGFQVSSIFTRWFQKGKSRIQRRLDKSRDTLVRAAFPTPPPRATSAAASRAVTSSP